MYSRIKEEKNDFTFPETFVHFLLIETTGRRLLIHNY